MELKLDPSKIYAIALEGGGARGAYQVGAWRALEEAGIRYNAVSGTSLSGDRKAGISSSLSSPRASIAARAAQICPKWGGLKEPP